jgi:hypothetical protein
MIRKICHSEHREESLCRISWMRSLHKLQDDKTQKKMLFRAGRQATLEESQSRILL